MTLRKLVHFLTPYPPVMLLIGYLKVTKGYLPITVLCDRLSDRVIIARVSLQQGLLIQSSFMSPDFTNNSYCNICEQIDLKNVI